MVKIIKVRWGKFWYLLTLAILAYMLLGWKGVCFVYLASAEVEMK